MKKFISTIILLYLYSSLLFAQDQNTTNSLINYEKVDWNTINQAEPLVKDNPGLAIVRLDALLKTFYKDQNQPPLNKSEQLDNSPYLRYQRDWSSNEQRLLLKEFLRKPQEITFVEDAPNLFKAHYLLAKAYKNHGDLFQAANHFNHSLKYRRLKMSKEYLVNPERISLSDDKEQSSVAQNMIDLKEKKKKEEETYDKLKIELYTLEETKAQGGATDKELTALAENRKITLANQKKIIDAIDSQINSQTSKIDTLESNYNNESSDVMMEMAELMFQIENEIMESRKVADQKEFYEKSYDFTKTQEWYTLNKHGGYQNFLEAALRLNKNNSNAAFKLGELYQQNGNDNEAIYAFESFLETPIATKPENNEALEKVEAAFNFLGGLYHKKARYVDSVWFYEKALAISTRNKDLLKKNIIDNYIHHTGNYKRALELLDNMEKTRIVSTEKNPLTQSLFIKEQIIRFSQYCIIYEKLNSSDKLILSLNDTVKIFNDLKQIESQFMQKINSDKNNLVQLKKEMVATRSEESRQIYYQALSDLEENNTQLASVQGVRKSLDMKKIYFTLAIEMEKVHKIKTAIEIYQLAEADGVSPEDARREISRLKAK